MKKREDTNLAEGEVTGHAHRCFGQEISVFDVDYGRLLDAPNGCDITHEEHKTITLDTGKYDTFQAIEYDPFEEEIRRVAD